MKHVQSWSDNRCSSWRAFYVQLFADCRALGIKPWTGNPMTWASSMYQVSKMQDTCDEEVEENFVDNIPAHAVDPHNATLDDMNYGMNPEEIMMFLEDQPRLIPFQKLERREKKKARRARACRYFQQVA